MNGVARVVRIVDDSLEGRCAPLFPCAWFDRSWFGTAGRARLRRGCYVRLKVCEGGTGGERTHVVRATEYRESDRVLGGGWLAWRGGETCAISELAAKCLGVRGVESVDVEVVGVVSSDGGGEIEEMECVWEGRSGGGDGACFSERSLDCLSGLLTGRVVVQRGTWLAVSWLNRIQHVYVDRLKLAGDEVDAGVLVVRRSTRVKWRVRVGEAEPRVSADWLEAWRRRVKEGVVGLDGVIDEVTQGMCDLMSESLKGEREGDWLVRGYVFHGGVGTGKSELAVRLARSSGLNWRVVNLSSLKYWKSGQGVKDIFAEAVEGAPFLLIFEDFRVGGSDCDLSERWLLSVMMRELDALRALARPVMVIVICSSLGDVGSSLFSPGRLEREYEFSALSAEGRESLLALRTECWRFESEEERKRICRFVASRTSGFVGADLDGLCARVFLKVLAESSDGEGFARLVCASDFEGALCLPGVLGHSEGREEVRFDELGGLDDVIEELRCSTVLSESVKSSRGILLYGPSGTGKSRLVMALATELKFNFVFVRAASLISSYVGVGEQAASRLFADARASAPCIIYVDQLEQLAAVRSEAHAEQLTSLLLTEMDGFLTHSDRQLLFIGSTTRPDLLDPAILRPGRLDLVLFVPPPKACQRLSIVRVLLRRFPSVQLTADQCSVLAERTKCYTGADLQSLFTEAILASLREDIDARRVEWRHVWYALSATRPSVDLSSIVHPLNRPPGASLEDYD
ncbi:uncharacterized protein LOC126313404 [Schistocerca gregaria]|uniref:uncharacterized protein LOC126313404 n=1 Tax=Schistocerca gregaria TaxID=7010 RepID=UPI00211E5F25|nr:uncharacterized protein LOC126313404 [Schistocerca gregaria]